MTEADLPAMFHGLGLWPMPGALVEAEQAVTHQSKLGSNGVQWGPKNWKNWAKTEKPKIQKTVHKRIMGFEKMGFW